MKRLREIFFQLRPGTRFYVIWFSGIVLLVFAHFIPWLFEPVTTALYALLLLCVVDLVLLFRHQQPVNAWRSARYNRLSNGDVNELHVDVESEYAFTVNLTIIEELPYQFQQRHFTRRLIVKPGQGQRWTYTVRPVERGEYHFGTLNLLVLSPLGLLIRQFKTGNDFVMGCYPSFIKLRQFELLAISSRLNDTGLKKTRRVGRSTEFEQIKEYVRGDDIRTINWKATARRAQLMANHYRDERAQNVISVVDTGRVMKMPFEGMTLLDYAINASLVIGHVAWIKQDKPGLLCFSDKINARVNPDRKGNQLLRLQESLYRLKTDFNETNFENLVTYASQRITQRSLLIIYTNFETLNGLRRQLKYLKRLATRHLVMVVFFENTELNEFLTARPQNTFAIYEQTIAQKFDYEKRLVNRELRKYGIISVYTPPARLTVNTVNKYIEIKTRGQI